MLKEDYQAQMREKDKEIERLQAALSQEQLKLKIMSRMVETLLEELA